MAPGEIYQVAIVLTALFVAPFDVMARVVVLAWFGGRGLWGWGVPEPAADLLVELTILWFGRRHQVGTAARIAWLLSIPLAAINTAWLAGLLDPVVAWWVILITALVRLAVLPFALDRETVSATIRRLHERIDSVLHRRVPHPGGPA